jgi:ribonuclease J
LSSKSLLKIIPLGGVGEIGSNITVFETENHYLAIDYGILFPYEEFFDLNYLIVDTSLISEDKKIVLFITHGHEDHIGAVHHFIKKYPSTILYAPPFAATLIRRKFESRNIQHIINVYEEDFELYIDDITLHPVHVTHSIPDTFGVILVNEKRDYSILFISDFKVDYNPVFEKPININKIEQLFNHSKKRLCFLDSTNILLKDKTKSESDLIPDIEMLISKPNRSFITLFSSNIFRLKIILNAARKFNKIVVPIGRSFEHYLDAANTNEIINISDEPIKKIEEIKDYENTKYVYLLTGCQGDHLGALRRIASNEHRELKFKTGDNVIFSSKPIPGNSKKISRIYNDITLQGANVITDKDYLIHASGHPGQDDLHLLLKTIQPTDYFPIHGEDYFLKKHIEFIHSNYKFKAHLISNFIQIQLLENHEFLFSQLESKEPILIHGNDLEIEREFISERRKLACNGLIVIFISRKDASFKLTYRGLPIHVQNYIDTFHDILHEFIFIHSKNKQNDILQEDVRIKTRQMFNNILGYKPISIVEIF